MIFFIRKYKRTSDKKQNREHICHQSHGSEAEAADRISHETAHSKAAHKENDTGCQNHQKDNLILKPAGCRLLFRAGTLL